MTSEKPASRFVESGVLQPPSPTMDAATLKRLEAGDHGPLPTPPLAHLPSAMQQQKSPDITARRGPLTRSAHSSYSGTPAVMQIPDATAADLPVVSKEFLFTGMNYVSCSWPNIVTTLFPSPLLVFDPPRSMACWSTYVCRLTKTAKHGISLPKSSTPKANNVRSLNTSPAVQHY